MRAIKIGEDLLKAKAQAGHGNFLKWVKDNCDLSDKTAERYMKFAENKSKLMTANKDKFETISNLTLAEAERLIDGNGSGSGSGRTQKTKLQKLQAAWTNATIPDQTAFVKEQYNDVMKLIKEVDRLEEEERKQQKRAA